MCGVEGGVHVDELLRDVELAVVAQHGVADVDEVRVDLLELFSDADDHLEQRRRPHVPCSRARVGAWGRGGGGH